MTITRLAIVLGAALSLLALAGCTATATSTPSDSSKPSRSASASASPSADPNELFRITAVLVSPEGGRIEISQTATAPSDLTADDSSLLAENQCQFALDPITDPKAVHVTVVSRQLSDPEPDSGSDLIILSGGDAGTTSPSPTAFTGGWRTWQASCADGLLTVPGTATGLTVYPDASDGAGGWASGSWGVSGVREPTDVDPVSFYAVEECTIDLGPAAPRDLDASWNTPDTEHGCLFGPQR